MKRLHCKKNTVTQARGSALGWLETNLNILEELEASKVRWRLVPHTSSLSSDNQDT